MKKNLIGIILLFCAALIWANGPVRADLDSPTSDGGYIIAGRTNTYTNGDFDILIYKLDAAGSKQWRKNFGGLEYENGYSVQQTSDGGYIVAGSSQTYNSGSTDNDFLIYKLNTAGNKSWRKNYGGVDTDYCFSIRQTTDGGYVAAGWGYSYHTGANDSDFLVYKLDASGNKQWRKNYGGTGYDYGSCVRQTTDGGYIFIGRTGSYHHDTSDTDFLLYKLDASGAKQWRKNYGGARGDYGQSVCLTADGGYIAAGYGYSYSYDGSESDLLLYKLDSAGNKLWRKNYGGAGYDAGCSVQPTSDGGYIIAGKTNSYTHGFEDFLVYKLDAAGNKQWRKNYGGSGYDSCASVCVVPGGGYILIGQNTSYTNGQEDFLLYKIDAAGKKEWRKNYGGTGWEGW